MRRLKNTCSKPSLLLPFGQMAVRVELGVGARWRTCGFGPSFPLDEVGDPTLSQRGGLRHVVPHRLRDACVTERDRSDIWSHMFKNMKIKKIYMYLHHSRKIWRAPQIHGCPHFSWSLLEIFLTLESFQSLQNSPAKHVTF